MNIRLSGERELTIPPLHSDTAERDPSCSNERPESVNALSFLYHDVVKRGGYGDHGCHGFGAVRYRMDCEQFERHLALLHQTLPNKPAIVQELLSSRRVNNPVLLTFDDGGVSAYTNVMEILDRYQWKAHFFVVTDWIGKTGYLDVRQLRILRSCGHVIGTHSCSHPSMMASLGWETIWREWEDSVRRLSDVLGEHVVTASVPGGDYSTEVAEAASYAGIKALFTSEPVQRTYCVRNCRVFGRYAVLPTDRADWSTRLVNGHSLPRYTAYVLWNLRKMAKRTGKHAYLRLRLMALRGLYGR